MLNEAKCAHSKTTKDKKNKMGYQCALKELSCLENNEEIEQLNASQDNGLNSNSQDNLEKEQSNNNKLFVIYTVCFFFLIILIITISLIIHNISNRVTILLDDEDIRQPYRDDNSYRIIRLKNEITAVLISDDSAINSEFSLNLKAGDFMNQYEYGVVQLLEKLIFGNIMFTNYIHSNRGILETFSKDDKTGLYFQMTKKKFPVALLMLKDLLVNFDVNNHTEIQYYLNTTKNDLLKNNKSDLWREFQILKELGEPMYPTYNLVNIINLDKENINNKKPPNEMLNKTSNETILETQKHSNHSNFKHGNKNDINNIKIKNSKNDLRMMIDSSKLKINQDGLFAPKEQIVNKSYGKNITENIKRNKKEKFRFRGKPNHLLNSKRINNKGQNNIIQGLEGTKNKTIFFNISFKNNSTTKTTLEKVSFKKNIFELYTEEDYLQFYQSVENFFYNNFDNDRLLLVAKSSLSLDELTNLINDIFGQFTFYKYNKRNKSNQQNQTYELINNWLSNQNILPYSKRKLPQFEINNLKKFIGIQTNSNLNRLNVRSHNFINNSHSNPLKQTNISMLENGQDNNSLTNLDIVFPINSFDIANDKSYEYITYLLKYQGKNSLIDILKRKLDLIEFLSADYLTVHENLGFYIISLELKNTFVEDHEVNLIVQVVFEYLHTISTNLIESPKRFEILLDDLKKISLINFENFDVVNEIDDSFITNFLFFKTFDKIQKYPLKNIFYGDYDMSKTSLKNIKNFTNYLNINNSIIVYLSPIMNHDLIQNFTSSKSLKNTTEKIFKTNYFIGDYFPKNTGKPKDSNSKIIAFLKSFVNKAKIKYNKLTNSSLNISYYNFDKIFNLDSIRKKNDFITSEIKFSLEKTKKETQIHDDYSSSFFTNFNLPGFFFNDNKKNLPKIVEAFDLNKYFGTNIKSSSYYSDETDLELPMLKIDKENFRLYYLENKNLRTNQIAISLEFLMLNIRGNPIDVMNIHIYNRILSDSLANLLSDAIISGNKISNIITNDGILVRITCFKDIALNLLNKIVDIFYNKNNIMEINLTVYLFAKIGVFSGLKKTLMHEPLEKLTTEEIFEKVIKWNVTNKYELFETYYRETNFERFDSTISSIISDTSIKSIVYSNSFNSTFVDLISNEIYPKFDNFSTLKSSDIFYLMNLNRVLDASYIFKKSIPSLIFKERILMNIFEIGNLEPKKYSAMKIIEFILQTQFTVENLLSLDSKSVNDMRNSMIVTNANIMYYKFSFITENNFKYVLSLFRKRLEEFEFELSKISDDDLEDFKILFLNRIKINRESKKLSDLNSQAELALTNLKINSIPISEIFKKITKYDIINTFNSVFHESKTLQIEISEIKTNGHSKMDKIDPSEKSRVVYDFQPFNRLRYFNEMFKSEKEKKSFLEFFKSKYINKKNVNKTVNILKMINDTSNNVNFDQNN